MARLSPVRALLPGLLALAPFPCPAQDAPPAAVPADLALALLGDPDAALVVGEAPGPLAALPLPPAARVLGGMTQPRATTAVVGLALEPGAALDAAGAALAGGAWSAAPGLFTGRVFEDAGAPRPRMLCGPGASLRVSAGPAAAGGSLVRYVHTVLAGALNVCNPPPAFARDQPIDAAPVPLLVNPEGLEQRGGRGGGGPSSREATTRLATPMGAVELAAHYARQMTEQGWTLAAASEAPAGAALSWWRDGDDGTRWHALLLVTPLPSGSEKEVLFRLWDPTADG